MNNLTIAIYEHLLEPLLHSWKSRVAKWIKEDSPGLTLDLCCGTGKQCRLIAEHSAVIGLDLDLDLLMFAKSTAPHISFVCADAALLPFKKNVFQHANISLALHDKSDALRKQIIIQTKHTLKPDGRFFIIDFEKPYSWKSRTGYSLVFLIELMAGREHFANGREFVTSGGLASFLKRNHLETVQQHKSQWGSSAIIKARFFSEKI